MDDQMIHNLNKAIRDLNKVIRLDPENALAYISRGTAYDKKGDYDNAIKDYDKAIKLNSEDAEAYLLRGDAYLGKADYDSAIADYDKAIKLNPEEETAYEGKAYAYRKKGDNAQAEATKAELLNIMEDQELTSLDGAIRVSPENAEAYYNRGLFYDARGDFDLAIADYSKAIQLAPQGTRASYYKGRADAYYGRVSYDMDCDKAIANLDLAIADYEKVGYDRPGELIGMRDPTIHVFLYKGELYAEKGDYDRAIEAMSEVIRRDNVFSEVYDELYDEFALRIDGSWASDRRSSIKFGSESAGKAYNNRGFYHSKQGNYDQAIVDLKEALKLYDERLKLDPSFNPNFAAIYLNLGYIYYAKNDYNSAVENYDNVVRLCPNYETDFINSKFAHGGKAAVEAAIELLTSIVAGLSEADVNHYYYTGVRALFDNDGLSARRAFQIALNLGYDGQAKIEKHFENLQNRE